MSQERDSLILEVTATGRLLSDIQTELAKTTPTRQPATGVESPALEITKDQRTFVLERVREFTARLKDAETRLAASERRARRLTLASDSLSRGFNEAKASIIQLADLVASQKSMAEALTHQVESLTLENLALSDSVLHLTDDQNTAFYVVGTQQELIARGVLVQDGRRSVPLIGKRAAQPARELPLAEFTSIDRQVVRAIPLPRNDRKYQIVSRQNLSYLEQVGSKGRIQGEIAIRSPEQFWEPSRYLIVVESGR